LNFVLCFPAFKPKYADPKPPKEREGDLMFDNSPLKKLFEKKRSLKLSLVNDMFMTHAN
jgi:hypothetical protein